MPWFLADSRFCRYFPYPPVADKRENDTNTGHTVKPHALALQKNLCREQKQQERENRERRSDLQRFERRLTQKEELLDKRVETVEKQEKEFIKREAALDEKTEFLSGEEERYREELERISGLTQQQAKDLIIRNLETEAKHDAVTIINKIEC